MSDNFTFELVTTRGIQLTDLVEYVIIPSSSGEVTILPGHCAYITLVKNGTVSYLSKKSNKVETLEVSNGSCEYKNDKLVLICDDRN